MLEEDFKKYIAGFFDADGSVYITKRNTLTLTFSQSNIQVLEYIMKFYPTCFNFHSRRRDDNQRQEFSLSGTGLKLRPVIQDLEEHCIMKFPQIQKAREFLSYVNKRTTDKKNEIMEIVKHMNHNKDEYTDMKPYERINPQYIAGLFDGDGTVGIYNNKVNASIAQKSDINMLMQIHSIYVGSTMDETSVYFGNKRVIYNFLNDIYEYCIYKKEQVIKSLEFLKTKNKALIQQVKDLKQHDINIEYQKKYIENCLNDLYIEYSSSDLLLSKKKQDILNQRTNANLEKHIFDEFENFNIKPKLIFCEKARHKNIWMYFRHKVSSLPHTGKIGRQIKILVMDEISGKYLGIMSLGSDFYSLKERDEYIQKHITETKDKYLRNIINLNTCVPLQPFGYNTNGGKLLASLAFSREIFDYYYKKYNEPLFAVTTTSINGKSIQYDRLNCLKFIGYTKGYGSTHIPEELYGECKLLFDNMQLKTNRVGRFDIIMTLISALKIKETSLFHGSKRGIYFGWLFDTKFSNNYDVNSLKSVSEITEHWKTRWCNNRLTNLFKSNRISTDKRLYDVKYFENISYKEYVLPKKILKNEMKRVVPEREEIPVDDMIEPVGDDRPSLIRRLDKDQLFEVMNLKHIRDMAQEDACDMIRKKYNIIIERDHVSNLWKGEYAQYLDEEILQSDIYVKMLENTRIRAYKGRTEATQKKISEKNRSSMRSFTEEQMISIMREKKTAESATKCGAKYISKKGLPLKRCTIQNIWSGELLPLNEASIDDEYRELLEHKRS